MSRNNTVVVGVDGSAASLRGVQWAAGEAAQRGWNLKLLCAYERPTFTAAIDGGYAAIDESAIRDAAQNILDNSAQEAANAGISVETELVPGDAAAALIRASEECGLIVIGTRGGGGFTRRLLGSVSSTVPAHAKCSVVIVPMKEDDDEIQGGMIQWQPRHSTQPIEKIVVGVDGSKPSSNALKVAIAQAITWNAELTAVSAVPVGSSSGMLAWLPAAIDHQQVLSDLAEGLGVAIDTALAEYEGDIPEGFFVRRHVLDGTGAALLTEFSTAVDLLVVGSRGRGGFAGMLMGSTSQTILHHSACPVMVVTPKDPVHKSA